MTTAVDSAFFTNISATTAAFALKGGKYLFAVYVATFGGGSVAIQRQGPDGTYYNVLAALTAVGSSNVDLPPGLYKFALTTATGVTCEITGVPY